MLLKVGGVNQPRVRVENTTTMGSAKLSCCIKFQHLFRGIKTVLIYFLNIVTLHDVIYVQNKRFKHHPGYLFCSSFLIKQKHKLCFGVKVTITLPSIPYKQEKS